MMTIWGMGLLFMFSWCVCLWYVICELGTCVWRAEVNGGYLLQLLSITFIYCFYFIIYLILFLFLYRNFIVLLFKYILCIYLFCLNVYLNITCISQCLKRPEERIIYLPRTEVTHSYGFKSSTLNGWLANKTLDSSVSTFLYLNCASELSLHAYAASTVPTKQILQSLC